MARRKTPAKPVEPKPEKHWSWQKDLGRAIDDDGRPMNDPLRDFCFAGYTEEAVDALRLKWFEENSIIPRKDR